MCFQCEQRRQPQLLVVVLALLLQLQLLLLTLVLLLLQPQVKVVFRGRLAKAGQKQSVLPVRLFCAESTVLL